MTQTAAVSWAAAELGGATLGDARLNRRVGPVAERLGAPPEASLPVACGGWAETQAADRLLAHEHVDWEAGLGPHWDWSLERRRHPPSGGCVQDSTAFDCTTQPGIAGLGPLSSLRQPGLYVHPTLAITPDGVPLGGLAVGFWTRDRATFGAAQRHWPLDAKESRRWLEGFERCTELAESLPATHLVYLADRECAMHAFMRRTRRGPGSDWLIRAPTTAASPRAITSGLAGTRPRCGVRSRSPARPDRTGRAGRWC